MLATMKIINNILKNKKIPDANLYPTIEKIHKNVSGQFSNNNCNIYSL